MRYGGKTGWGGGERDKVIGGEMMGCRERTERDAESGMERFTDGKMEAWSEKWKEGASESERGTEREME